MSIRIKRIGLMAILVIGILETFFIANGARVSVGTVSVVCCIYGVFHLLGLNIGKREKSFYIKDLNISEKVIAAFTFALIVMWFVAVIMHF